MEKQAKSKKESREEKIRDQKLEEVVLKSLEECPTMEEKLQHLLRKNLESEKQVLQLTGVIKSHQRNIETAHREKEQLQREHNKSILMRDKLQEVCREQQKIIKSVKNESLLKIREEEERRKESQAKFQLSLNEITQSLSKNNEENLKLRDYNIEITQKLKYLAEQYQTREKQLEKLGEQVTLESQLHQAKLSKVQVEAAMEKEILTKENQIAVEKLLHSQRMIKELTDREQALKDQLNIYTAKYDEFQGSLQKSNEIFANYKVELDKMSKHTKKLEKEALLWRNKYEKANASVIELATEKQQRDEHAARCSRQVEQLQKLLRALQAERTNLHKTLRDHKIEIPDAPPLPEEPTAIPLEVVSGEKDKMAQMTRSCAELKETLANLQNQMNMLKVEPKEHDKNSDDKDAKKTQANNANPNTNNTNNTKRKKKNNKKLQKKQQQAAEAEAEAKGDGIDNEPTLESNIETTDETMVPEVPKANENAVPTDENCIIKKVESVDCGIAANENEVALNRSSVLTANEINHFEQAKSSESKESTICGAVPIVDEAADLKQNEEEPPTTPQAAPVVETS